MNLFKQLHLKFLIIPLIAVGSLLAITFCTIFGITYFSTMSDIDKMLEEASISASATPQSNKYLYIVFTTEKDGKSSYNYHNFFSFKDDEVSSIVSQVVESDSNTFMINGRHFNYAHKGPYLNDREQSVTIYYIVETTDQYNTIKTLAITLLTVYIVSLVIIAGLSYILAYNATKPVKDAFEKERDLVANASHELKTPLTIARTNLELIASDPNTTVAENIKWLESARYQIDRMNNLILQMLELSKMERDGYTVEKSDINISELIEGILLSFEAGCYENNIRFVEDIQPNIEYKCNKVETEKLITILVDNALKYTPRGGEIAVVMAKTLKDISIKVTNTGEGIPPEKVAKIFERFYKLDEAHKESGNSFGLGLSIAKLIATSMGGDIKCYSVVGEYTTFEIILPIR